MMESGIKFDWQPKPFVPPTSDAKITRYKVITWLVFTGVIAVGFVLGGIGIGLAVVFLFAFWIPARDRGVLTLYQSQMDECDQAISETGQDFHEYYQNFRWKQMVDDVFGLGQRQSEYAVCRTCSEFYPNRMPTVCHSLQDVFPHDPTAEPPHSNPFQWYWLKAHGYATPPAGWPENRPWLPLSALAGVEAMIAEGRSFYSSQPNSVWDNGFGNPPDWYTTTHVAQAA
jgi:hypothetical protein